MILEGGDGERVTEDVRLIRSKTYKRRLDRRLHDF